MTKHKILTVVLLSGLGTTAASASPSVAPDHQQPKERLELRAKLYASSKAEVATKMERFRALCDAEGYPLVGNVANKGMRYEVADYCRDVRAAAKVQKDA